MQSTNKSNNLSRWGNFEMVRELDEYDFQLLESVLIQDRYLHMGKSPVTAIQKCWELCDMEFLTLKVGGWVSITDKGRALIKERSRF